MALLASKNFWVRHHISYCFPRYSTSLVWSSQQLLQESLKRAIAKKSYEQIPDLLSNSEKTCKSQNPFSFLSAFTSSYRTQVVDEMLQSFIPLKSHLHLKTAFHYLLIHTLQSSQPFPLSLAILQSTLRSGCSPVPQVKLFLSSVWMEYRSQYKSVPSILMDMKPIGYGPDSGTCNFIIASLCAVDHLDEAVELLKGMVEALVIPDVESYSAVVTAFCAVRKTDEAVAFIKEMVGRQRLSPRQGTLVKLAACLNANKEIWVAIELIEFLEKKGVNIGFECYELVLKGCLHCREFILAAKVAMMMTEKGYIPYITVRQRVIKGLAGVGEWKLTFVVRHKFAELNS